MMRGQVYVDGEFVSASDPVLGAFEPGLTVGLGCFETLCVERGCCHYFSHHYKRFRKSLKLLNIPLMKVEELELAVNDLIERNELSDARARVRMTMYKRSSHLASLVITAVEAPEPSDKPLRVALSNYTVNVKSPLAGIKSTSYAENILALEMANLQGADEALMLNSRSDLCEGATTNLFWISDGVLYTPSKKTGCLPGVTRKVVIQICEEFGIPLEKVEHSIDSLIRADAAFLTNALHGIRPVKQLGEFSFPQVQHPITRKISETYIERTSKN